MSLIDALLSRLAGRAPSPPPPAGLLSPDALQIGPTSLQAGATCCRSFAVTGYPHQVGPGWLEPLASYPGNADIALHLDPIPPPVATQRLRRQLGRLESTRRLDEDRGRLADLEVEAAAEDAHQLARRLARGQGRLYAVGLYVTVRGKVWTLTLFPRAALTLFPRVWPSGEFYRVTSLAVTSGWPGRLLGR